MNMPLEKCHIGIDDDLTLRLIVGDKESSAHLSATDALELAALLVEKAKTFRPWAGSSAADFCEAAATAALGDLKDVIGTIKGAAI